METLEDDRSAQKAEISLPAELSEQILSRLPVKSLLRFKSVSKPWQSLISNSSFTKLHSAVGRRTTALFFSVYDSSIHTRYFFSGGHDDGSVANLMKLDNTTYNLGLAEHLNGLVCFTSRPLRFNKLHAFVLNPSTHKFFKLPDPVPDTGEERDNCYLFGFDEYRNEHKVLYLDFGSIKLTTMEVMIFSVTNYTWRKIEVDLPVGVSRDRWLLGLSVCVNSVIHLMLRRPLGILAFDLTTNKFSIVQVPPEAVPQNWSRTNIICPYTLVKINGLLGVACRYLCEDTHKAHIWILQDYEKRVWVEETITFPEKYWIDMGACYGPHPLDSVNMDEIIFSPSMLSEDLISVPIYNMKTRCFKSIQLTLDHQFLRPKLVQLEQIKCYVESLIPLQN